MDPSKRNKSLQCDYHRDNGNETNRRRSLKFLVENHIKAGHLQRYIKEINLEVELEQAAATTVALLESRLAINYILDGLFDNQYQSKRQKKKLLRAATIKA